MKKNFIEILQDIKDKKIKEGTRIKNIETEDEYVFKSGNFRREGGYSSHFLRRCNLEATYEFVESEIKLYDLVNWSGFEWYVIDIKDGKYTLFLKDKLSKEMVERLFNSNFLDSDSDVRFNTNPKNIWWKDSHIRMTLNSEYLKYLNLSDLSRMTTTVKIDDKESTTEDYVRLITKEETKKLPQEILKYSGEYGYWTMTPSRFVDWGSASEVYVTGSGELFHWYDVSYVLGVRPVIQVPDVNKLAKLER